MNKEQLTSQTSPSKTIHMIGNGHIDPVWLWRWPEGYEEVNATFNSALDRMDEDDEVGRLPESSMTFSASSSLFYEWTEEHDPEAFAKIQQRVEEGKWSIVGGMYIEPDGMIPGGESLVRQQLYAQHYFQEKFGRIARTEFLPDSFALSPSLPQLLSKAGKENFVFMRPQPHESIPLPIGTPFYWQTPDGSSVLASRIIHNYSKNSHLSLHIDEAEKRIEEPFEDMPSTFGVGNHGGGGTVTNRTDILHEQATRKSARVIFSTYDTFFDTVRDKHTDQDFKHICGELGYHAVGCPSTHSAIKRHNREAEHTVIAAEKFSSFALRLIGKKYPDYTKAWKPLLFNQFHDIISGTSLEEACDEAIEMYGQSKTEAQHGMNEAVQAIMKNIEIPKDEKTSPFVVFNPHTWETTSIVEMEFPKLPENAVVLDADSQQVPWQELQSNSVTGRRRIGVRADLPSLGYATYRLASSENPQSFETIDASPTRLENDRYVLEIDEETGYIKNLTDKRINSQLFYGPAGIPVVIDDPFDTWGHEEFSFLDEIDTFKVKEKDDGTGKDITLTEHGPVRSSISVKYEYGKSKVVQEFSMSPDSDDITVRTTVDWHEKHKMLKFKFPMSFDQRKATFEVPYGTIQRPGIGLELPAQSWVDVSGTARYTDEPVGVSILNDGKYSYNFKDRTMYLTALRSPVYAHHTPAVLDPQKDYSYIDQGKQQFTYVILPHLESWEDADTVKKALELNQKPVALKSSYHPDGTLPQRDSFMQVESQSVIVTAVKKAEDNDDLIIRCFESHGKKGQSEITLNDGRIIRSNYQPHELKTFRVPKDTTQPYLETNLLEIPLE